MDSELFDSLLTDVRMWVWWASLPWAGVVAAMAAGVFAGVRDEKRVVPAVAAAGAAGWLAGPVAAAAASGLVAGWCVAGRWIRWRDRAHRSLLAGCAVLAALRGTHLWAVSSQTSLQPSSYTGVAVLVVVAVLLLFVRPSRPVLDPQRLFTAAQRAEVVARDGNRCGYCGAPGDALGVQLAVDHVVAHSKGGRTDTRNARMACSPCNSLKSDMDWSDFVNVFRRRHGFAPGEFAHGSRLLRLFRS